VDKEEEKNEQSERKRAVEREDRGKIQQQVLGAPLGIEGKTG
jgi:hypothetical protein